MWTRQVPSNGPTWTQNHFVPLVEVGSSPVSVSPESPALRNRSYADAVKETRPSPSLNEPIPQSLKKKKATESDNISYKRRVRSAFMEKDLVFHCTKKMHKRNFSETSVNINVCLYLIYMNV